MHKLRLKYLFGLYLSRKIKEQENIELMHLIADKGNKEDIITIIEKVTTQINSYRKLSEYTSGKILHEILTENAN